MPYKLSTWVRIFSLSLITLLTLLTAQTAQATLLVPDDQSYTTFRFRRTKLLIADSYKSHATLFIPYTDYFLNQYEKSFDWKLDETMAFVVASPRNQIANGITFNTPNLEMVFFPSGMQLLDTFAVKSWFHVLLAHESAHLFQLNAKERTSSFFKRIFGNSVVPFFPIPLFLQPNDFLPTFALEGNAVLNESRFGLGGRLFSGEVRAEVYALLRENKTTMKRLMNDHIYFPFGAEKYFVGGYFMAYLAERFGVDKVNSFFKANAIHWINPLLLNRTFKSTFGSGYQALWNEFVQAKRPEFEKQGVAKEPAFLNFFFMGAINADDSKVYFVAQTDGRKRPVVVSVDKNSLTPQIESQQLEIGKLFFLDDGTPATVSGEQNSVHKIQYSLYGPARKFYPEYQSKIVQDRRNGHLLSVNAATSLVEAQLELDGQFLDTTHSSAILDSQGHAYYFKQDRLERILFRDKVEIARFKGFYSKPLEVLANGDVLFIGATPYGSSLFSVNHGKIQRLSNSDVIVDARMLNDKKILAIEVSGSAFQAKIIDRVPSHTQPAQYVYNFDKSKEFEILQGSPERQLSSENVGPVEENSSYFEPWHLRYSSTLFSSFIGPTGYYTLINTEFNDPLQYNNVTGTYMLGFKHRQSAQLAYTNTRHVLNYSLGALYDEDLLLGGTDQITIYDRHYNHTAYVDVAAPLFVWRRWTSSLLFETSYEHIAGTQGTTTYHPGIRNLGFFTAVKFNFLERYELSFAPYRQLGLTLAHKLVGSADRWKASDNILAAQLEGSLDLGSENIVSMNGGIAFATQHNIQIDDTFSLHQTPFTFSTLIPGLATMTPGFATRALAAEQVTLGYQKVINHGFYFTKFPLSLRRFAPFAKGQYFWYRERVSIPFPSERDKAFWMYMAGVDFDTLIAHKAPVKITFAYAGDTLKRTADGVVFGLSTQLSF